MLANAPRDDVIGIMLNYSQSTAGDMRMVFTLNFCTAKDVDQSKGDEGVSLELVDGTDEHGETTKVPKLPADSRNDGLPKLYVHHNAFMKVLGATVDIEDMAPILYDREGNRMDPDNV